MRLQFQIKHLMWLVFVAAALLAMGSVVLSVAFLLAAFCYYAVILGLGVIWGARVTRMLQDTWTQADEDRSDLSRIEVVVKTAVCVTAGMATTLAIIFFGVVLVNMLFSELFW